MTNIANIIYQTTSKPKAWALLVLGLLLALFIIYIEVKIIQYILFKGRLTFRHIKYHRKGHTTTNFTTKNISKDVVGIVGIIIIYQLIWMLGSSSSISLIKSGVYNLQHHDEIVIKANREAAKMEAQRQKRAKAIEDKEEKKREAYAKSEGARMWSAYQTAKKKGVSNENK